MDIKDVHQVYPEEPGKTAVAAVGLSTTTDGSGVFALHDLPAGTYTITAYRNEYRGQGNHIF